MEAEATVADATVTELPHYASVIVDTGRGALALLRRDPSFAVVLCDVSMPDLSGAALLDRATYLEPSLASRFVFMSDAFTASIHEVASRVQGRVLERPFTGEILRFIVDRVAHPGNRVKRRLHVR
ncbi:MAG: hypothetical protein ACHREM_14375 [Polyangiales bacterium]